MGHEVLEALDADLSFAEGCVPVSAGSEWLQRVVEMKGVEVLQSDLSFECLQGLFPRFFGADVITCGEDVAGVDADADGDMLLEFIDQEAEMLKAVAYRRALSRCGLDEKTCVPFICEVL